LNNESKKWVNPIDYPLSLDGRLDDRLQSQDDEIFTIARLINCVQFKNTVAEDILKVLIGLPHVGEGANLNILIVRLLFTLFYVTDSSDIRRITIIPRKAGVSLLVWNSVFCTMFVLLSCSDLSIHPEITYSGHR
jgi:hypothetical protein